MRHGPGVLVCQTDASRCIRQNAHCAAYSIDEASIRDDIRRHHSRRTSLLAADKNMYPSFFRQLAGRKGRGSASGLLEQLAQDNDVRSRPSSGPIRPLIIAGILLIAAIGVSVTALVYELRDRALSHLEPELANIPLG